MNLSARRIVLHHHSLFSNVFALLWVWTIYNWADKRVRNLNFRSFLLVFFCVCIVPQHSRSQSFLLCKFVPESLVCLCFYLSTFFTNFSSVGTWRLNSQKFALLISLTITFNCSLSMFEYNAKSFANVFEVKMSACLRVCVFCCWVVFKEYTLVIVKINVVKVLLVLIFHD